ncbi:hypothetical protein ACFVAV_31595 [Nocardia sp. NPDC057663]|uniref:hypothetical protein n=1 Tax=Nocardia sp. NPDC057663 TaxID=3346201 RepID=UPI003671F425
MTAYDAVIVGAGQSGLAAAHHLRRYAAGLDFDSTPTSASPPSTTTVTSSARTQTPARRSPHRD